MRTASVTLAAAQAPAARMAGGEVVADASSASFAADPALFAADRSHPSSAGCAVIAARLIPAVLRAAGAGSSAHVCGTASA